MRTRRTRGRIAAIVVSVLVALGAVACGGDDHEAVVRTASGLVQGRVDSDHRVFQGIPFASPPVGELRWRSPRPVEAWTGVSDAREPGRLCRQNPEDPSVGEQSEDYLYLNVTTPMSKPERPRPVLVWLHGGGFYQGNAAEYGARRLAVEGDAVVVTANYRLGVFGFLRLPGMAEGGAFGLEDQQAALRWVRDNAAAFGGDPDNVTLFGESAGSMSTCAQLTAPGAAGLFHKAIMQSGTCLSEWPPYPKGIGAFDPPEYAETLGGELAARQGCVPDATGLDCLRAASAEALLPGMGRFTPSYGNPVLPTDPADALRDGRLPRIPLIVGNTRDEDRIGLAGSVPAPLPADEYRQLLAAEFGPDAAAVEAAYPADPQDNSLLYAKVSTDRNWAYTTRRARDLLAARTSVHAYEFADPAPPVYSGMPTVATSYGAYHGSELAYLFDIQGLASALNAEQRELAAAMVRYWTSFAHNGIPAAPGLPVWEPVDSGQPTPPVLRLAPGPGGIAPFDFDAEHNIGFWTALASG